MADAYFVLPEVGSGTIEDPFRPKYMDNPAVEKFYGGEAIVHNGENYYPVRVFAGVSDLQLLEEQPDTYYMNLPVLENALNKTPLFPADLDIREWALLFSKFLMQA